MPLHRPLRRFHHVTKLLHLCPSLPSRASYPNHWESIDQWWYDPVDSGEPFRWYPSKTAPCIHWVSPPLRTIARFQDTSMDLARRRNRWPMRSLWLGCPFGKFRDVASVETWFLRLGSSLLGFERHSYHRRGNPDLLWNVQATGSKRLSWCCPRVFGTRNHHDRFCEIFSRSFRMPCFKWLRSLHWQTNNCAQWHSNVSLKRIFRYSAGISPFRTHPNPLHGHHSLHRSAFRQPDAKIMTFFSL